jgi:chromosome segregation ATPase
LNFARHATSLRPFTDVILAVRVQLVDVEAGREALRKEIGSMQRKLDAADDDARQRDREQQNLLDEHSRASQQAADQRRSLENALDVTNAELGSIRAELSAAHGRVDGLEDQLARSESTRREAEVKLSSVVSIIRRSVGGFRTPERRDRSRSPERRSASPVKGCPSLFHCNLICLIYGRQIKARSMYVLSRLLRAFLFILPICFT